MRRLLILGVGYSAIECARRAAGQFDAISGTTRSGEKLTLLEAAGIDPVIFDSILENPISPGLAEVLAPCTDLLVSIAPDNRGDPVLNCLSPQLAAASNLSWICYLSTVGVYGDHGGGWVDETSECHPRSRRSVQRLAAEKAWREFALARNIPLAIFRLSGIYGPGRNAFVNIEQGRSRRLIKPGQVFNRIHRDDIAKAFELAASIRADGIFNITDDEPAPPQDVVRLAHELQGSDPPPEIDFETADLSAMARSFYGENKRVSNARSKLSLGMEYDWPNYRTALARMWNMGSWRE